MHFELYSIYVYDVSVHFSTLCLFSYNFLTDSLIMKDVKISDRLLVLSSSIYIGLFVW